MNYAESQSYLCSIKKKHQINFGLEVVLRILEHNYFRQNPGKIIQVGGTNGKGTTSYYLASIFQKHGYKTGLFTSPHIFDIRERISVNNIWIKEQQFAKACFFIKNISKDLCAKKRIEREPTYFEFLFLIALYHFIHCKVDFIILEVGMGGRFDATTAIVPDISVITSISLDHEKFLGNDLHDIAFEKAGIIKKGVPVIMYMSESSIAGQVICDQARREETKCHQVFSQNKTFGMNPDFQFEYISNSHYKYQLKNPGIHFGKNAACAIRCVEVLQEKGKISISKKEIEQGLEAVMVLGRIETVNLPGRPKILIDVGHNPDSIKFLSETLRQLNIKEVVLVFGVLKDKKFKKMLDKLLEFAKITIITEPNSELACKGELIIDYLTKEYREKIMYIKDSTEAIKKALGFNRTILVAGSFYLVGPIREFLQNEVNCE